MTDKFPPILRDGKTNTRCRFGHDHTWCMIGGAMACGACGRLAAKTAKALGVDQNAVKVNVHAIGWLIDLGDVVGAATKACACGFPYRHTNLPCSR